MQHPTDDLVNRRPVWAALATLFLDTDPAATLESRARTLAASPYTLDELEQVFRDEVLPVCGASLASPAGEWAGFDEDWLAARILEASAKPASRAKRFVASWNAPSADWRATLDEVARLRDPHGVRAVRVRSHEALHSGTARAHTEDTRSSARMGAMEIVRATPDDLDDWTALRHALWGGDLARLRDEARALLDADDQVAFLARDASAGVVGFVEASSRTATSRTYAFVEGWFVSPSRRGAGHGARLLEAVEDWALHRGIDTLLSDTQPEHYPESLAAHARAGYVPVSTSTVLLKEAAADVAAVEVEPQQNLAAMLHHLSIGVRDIEQSARFYDGVLAALGYARVWSDLRPGEANQAVGYGVAGGGDRFAIKQRDAATAPGAGSHLAFAARSRSAVDAFHAAAIARGGTDDGAPGLRPHYGPDYYACFVVDPDGHRIEAVITTAEPAVPSDGT